MYTDTNKMLKIFFRWHREGMVCVDTNTGVKPGKSKCKHIQFKHKTYYSDDIEKGNGVCIPAKALNKGNTIV